MRQTPMRHVIVELEDSPIVEVWRLGQNDPDVIGLWAGESDLPTPAFISDAAADALRAGHTFYTPNRGIPPLRAALARYLERLYGVAIGDDRLAVTASGMSAVMLTCQGLLSPGDHAVAVTPSWPNVLRAMTICGAAVTEVALAPSADGWHLDLDRVFAACNDRTRVIYYASPGNPTGFMLEAAGIARLVDFARARGIAILADEVYHRLVYDRAVAPSILEIARADDPVYVVNTFSKSWAMTGWRMGWVVFPQGDAASFEKLIQFNVSGTPGFLQWGAAAALDGGEEFVRSFVERCSVGRTIALDALRAMPRAHTVPSDGAFYLMFGIEGVTDVMRFCKRAVLEARVGLAPGTAFGGGAGQMIRLCHGQSPERMRVAMERLARFIDGYAEG